MPGGSRRRGCRSAGCSCLSGPLLTRIPISGCWEDGLCFEGDDGNEETDPVQPHLRAIDAVIPMDRCFSEAVDAGITTVLTGPGSANPIGGQFAALKTFGKRVDKMIVRAPVAMKMALGENPKNVYHDKNQGSVHAYGDCCLIRDQLMKAKRYEEAVVRAEEDSEIDPPEYDGKCEALLPVLRGEVKVHFHAHRGRRYLYRHAHRGGIPAGLCDCTWQQKAVLLRTSWLKSMCVFSPARCCAIRSKPELRNLTPATPGSLTRAGVPPRYHGPSCLFDSVSPSVRGTGRAGGMDEEEALAAITCNPAQNLWD